MPVRPIREAFSEREASVMGWLFLEERFDRLTELVSLGLTKIGAMETKTTPAPEQKGE